MISPHEISGLLCAFPLHRLAKRQPFELVEGFGKRCLHLPYREYERDSSQFDQPVQVFRALEGTVHIERRFHALHG